MSSDSVITELKVLNEHCVQRQYGHKVKGDPTPVFPSKCFFPLQLAHLAVEKGHAWFFFFLSWKGVSHRSPPHPPLKRDVRQNRKISHMFLFIFTMWIYVLILWHSKLSHTEIYNRHIVSSDILCQVTNALPCFLRPDKDPSLMNNYEVFCVHSWCFVWVSVLQSTVLAWHCLLSYSASFKIFTCI